MKNSFFNGEGNLAILCIGKLKSDMEKPPKNLRTIWRMCQCRDIPTYGIIIHMKDNLKLYIVTVFLSIFHRQKSY